MHKILKIYIADSSRGPRHQTPHMPLRLSSLRCCSLETLVLGPRAGAVLTIFLGTNPPTIIHHVHHCHPDFRAYICICAIAATQNSSSFLNAAAGAGDLGDASLPPSILLRDPLPLILRPLRRDFVSMVLAGDEFSPSMVRLLLWAFDVLTVSWRLSRLGGSLPVAAGSGSGN